MPFSSQCMGRQTSRLTLCLNENSSNYQQYTHVKHSTCFDPKVERSKVKLTGLSSALLAYTCVQVSMTALKDVLVTAAAVCQWSVHSNVSHTHTYSYTALIHSLNRHKTYLTKPTALIIADNKPSVDQSAALHHGE